MRLLHFKLCDGVWKTLCGLKPTFVVGFPRWHIHGAESDNRESDHYEVTSLKTPWALTPHDLPQQLNAFSQKASRIGIAWASCVSPGSTAGLHKVLKLSVADRLD